MAQPLVMVAPNGARRSKTDHPALPVTIDELVQTAIACHAAGADALHAHVRDASGTHCLDAGLYAELLDEMARQLPSFPVQITTEAAGLYAPAEQRRLLALGAAWMSAALREITADGDAAAARAFYQGAAEQGTTIQHILYDPKELAQLADLIARGDVPNEGLSLLCVLGAYAPARNGSPADLDAFLAAREAAGLADAQVMVCAFGISETDCLLHAARKGCDCRVGFENNLYHPDGTLARDNAERVTQVRQALAQFIAETD